MLWIARVIPVEMVQVLVTSQDGSIETRPVPSKFWCLRLSATALDVKPTRW